MHEHVLRSCSLPRAPVWRCPCKHQGSKKRDRKQLAPTHPHCPVHSSLMMSGGGGRVAGPGGANLDQGMAEAMLSSELQSGNWRQARQVLQQFPQIVNMAVNEQVRDLTTWTIHYPTKDDPNHLGLRCNTLPEPQMALITSGCVPFRTRPRSTSRRSCHRCGRSTVPTR